MSRNGSNKKEKKMNTKNESKESPLRDRLWPDGQKEDPAALNPHWNDLPLSYRLWPDKTWPPQSTDLSGPAGQREKDRLFAKFYKQEKNNWD